jgi:hypothetical protein
LAQINSKLIGSSRFLYYYISNTMSIQTKKCLDLMEARSVPAFQDELDVFGLNEEQLAMWKNQEDLSPYDIVDKPKHYMLFGGEKETIDLLRDRLSHEELRGYLKGNMIKYLMRAGKKSDGEFQDICKMGKYVEMYKGEFADG